MRSTSLSLLLSAVLPAVLAQVNITAVASASNSTSVNSTLSWTTSANTTYSFGVVALTGQANTSTIPVSLLYPFGATSNLVSANSSTITFISCDAQDYPNEGSLGPDMVYTMAIKDEAAGILLYSTQSSGCSVSGNTSDFSRVWTLTSSADAISVRSNATSSSSPVIASVGQPATLNYNTYSNITHTTTSASATPTPSQTPSSITSSQGGLNTNVAMIILYTVTGVVTLLFLVIIATGAVRARRHPERYGPGAVLGRVRQTRAKGLARAMLDSLPIVKFRADEQPKPTDVELATTTDTADATRNNSQTPPAEHTDAAAQAPVVSPPTQTTTAAGPVVDPEIGPDQPAAQTYEHMGCSICTEDFEPGQDLRVLPCDHRFHPACVDPWLLNVSGTCPLCRIDLNPRRESTDTSREHTETSEGNDLPPPLEMDSPDPSGRNRTVRRSLIPYLSGAGDGEERLAALRRWRRERRERTGSVGPSDNSAPTTPAIGTVEEGRRRDRMSRLFGIRTRRHRADTATSTGGMGNPRVGGEGSEPRNAE